jgi:hypothetical protein
LDVVGLVGPQLQVRGLRDDDGWLQLLLGELLPELLEFLVGAEVAARVEAGAVQRVQGQ